METENEEVVDLDVEDEPIEDITEEPTTDWKAETEKLREKAIAQRERTKALRAQLNAAKAAVGVVATSKAPVTPPKADGLGEAQLDYLDLKGVSATEDIKIIEDIVAKTGMTVRQALQDEYVQAKLEANKIQREVKTATPGSTKRAGASAGNDLAAAIAKYEQSGFKELPSDYELRSAVVNAMSDKLNSNKPSWH